MSADNWFPVASASDLPPRHVFHGRLEGRELAIWRADDGHVNVWENRCLHRGVRLSIGINTGAELVCQYHGWRYANRSGGCTYIPAHPADAPARTVCNRTYPMLERHGIVWTHFCENTPAEPEPIGQHDDLVLRPVPISAPLELVSEMLSDNLDPGLGLVLSGDLSFSTQSATLKLFLQPADSNRTIVRGVFNHNDAEISHGQLLRDFNSALTEACANIEAEAARRPEPEPIVVVYSPVSAELAAMPEYSDRSNAIRVTVAKKISVGEGICSLELTPLSGALPSFQPGAHIDVSLSNGLVRQYSLVNNPGETDRYVIGVKRENPSQGGSEFIHETLREGDLLAISEPRNNFPLRRDAEQTILIAGGIGVTPLLSMAGALDGQNLDFAFHYFAQNERQLAFPDRIMQIEKRLTCHLDLSPEQTHTEIGEILSSPSADRQVYICGPGPMLDAARDIAEKRGWAENAVHFEYFKNTTEIDDSSSFEIALSRSALTLQVPAGRTILSVLRENGVDMPASCQQGACGTCLATVLDGEPDHQDVYLSRSEKHEGKKILTCVSRAKSKRLVLDV